MVVFSKCEYPLNLSQYQSDPFAAINLPNNCLPFVKFGGQEARRVAAPRSLQIEHKKIEELLSFYVITACQDMEDKDLFEGEGDSSEDEENELVMLGLTSLLGTKIFRTKKF